MFSSGVCGAVPVRGVCASNSTAMPGRQRQWKVGASLSNQMLCVAVCCGVLRCVAVCCGALWRALSTAPSTRNHMRGRARGTRRLWDGTFTLHTPSEHHYCTCRQIGQPNFLPSFRTSAHAPLPEVAALSCAVRPSTSLIEGSAPARSSVRVICGPSTACQAAKCNAVSPMELCRFITDTRLWSLCGARARAWVGTRQETSTKVRSVVVLVWRGHVC